MMKLNMSMHRALVFAAVAFATCAAQATGYGGPNTYLGAFTPPPGSPSGTSLERNAGPTGFPFGPFTDYWIFSIAPSALLQVTAQFSPLTPLGITGWGGGIFSLTSSPTCTTVGASCTGVNISSVPLVTFTTSEDGVTTVGAAALTAGMYAVQLTGFQTTNPNQTVYTGELTFSAPQRLVPEPASLALLGLGMIGLALTRRRKIN